VPTFSSPEHISFPLPLFYTLSGTQVPSTSPFSLKSILAPASRGFSAGVSFCAQARLVCLSSGWLLGFAATTTFSSDGTCFLLLSAWVRWLPRARSVLPPSCQKISILFFLATLVTVPPGYGQKLGKLPPPSRKKRSKTRSFLRP